MTELHIDYLKKIFFIMDQNRDGLVDFHDLVKLFRNMGEEPQVNYIENLIKFADPKGNGKIRFEDFCNAINSGMSLR
jgi:Ca2+-binding EF-hand superfamily protein